ncbi:hypothetical protein F6476_13335 [Pseudomonas umsongensis]|uniref:hypothetical protein n=1 Tax=Pseudomonas umsongensis TaxID=198618 RepID=UPI001248FCE0|nr:hypothetical protein [Pseudomonas umsongensis]QFG30104.1 hypothetical protein F6476_13335 [Pseudomonas umsongensis]
MLREFIYQRDGQYRFDAICAGGDPVFIDELKVEAIEYVDAIVKRSRLLDVTVKTSYIRQGEVALKSHQ